MIKKKMVLRFHFFGGFLVLAYQPFFVFLGERLFRLTGYSIVVASVFGLDKFLFAFET
jgi:hypothetical protein